jgi:hypothetical protein
LAARAYYAAYRRPCYAVRAQIHQEGVEGLDGPWTPTTKALAEQSDANGLNLNRWWVFTPPEWNCPCCRRSKTAIARLDEQGRLLGALVAHHDHSDELLRHRLLEIAKDAANIKAGELTEAFMRRGTELLRAYDPILICQDCNNADSAAKQLVNAPCHFSFSAGQIASFIIARSCRPHEIDRAAAWCVWGAAQPFFKQRLALIDALAQLALENNPWLQQQSHKDRPSFVEPGF